MGSDAQFTINTARNWNYTGPQQDFTPTQVLSERLNNLKAEEKVVENTSSSKSLDWNRIVDNVFLEEIAKLSTGYSSNDF